MTRRDRQDLQQLLSYHAQVIGGARATVLGLQALIEAVERLRCPPEAFARHCGELLDVIRHSRPRLIPLIRLVREFEDEMLAHPEAEEAENLDGLKRRATHVLQAKIQRYQALVAAVTRHGLEHLEEGDMVIVHSPGSVVRNILIHARHEMGLALHFDVLVLQLDPIRTPWIARTLKEAEIPFQVVPVHDLCHYQAVANKLFIGALTVTADLMVIAPVGTANVLSICHLAGIRSYLFANTLHYSHGMAESQRIDTSEEDHVEPAGSYHLTSHSHDLIELSLIDVVINESGVVSLEELKA